MPDVGKLKGESWTPGQQSLLWHRTPMPSCTMLHRGLQVRTAPGTGTDASVRMLWSSISCASGALTSKGAAACAFFHKVGVPGDRKKPKQHAWIHDGNNWEGE